MSDGLDRQDRDCRERAKQLGATDVVVFRETVSGYKRTAKRKAFDAMTSYVREHRPEFLIAWKFDRYSRKGIRDVAAVSELVEETGVRFICLKDNLDSANAEWELLAAFAAHQARGESRNTALRMTSRKAKERREGKWTAQTPYGYVKTRDMRLIQHAERAKVVRRIADAYLDGASMSAIARALTADGIDAPGYLVYLERVARLRERGKREEAEARAKKRPANVWTTTSVKNILVNPVTAGMMAYKDQPVYDEHGEPVMVTDSPIISVAERRRILARRTSQTSVVRKPGKRTGGKASPGRPPAYLLTGFVVCECGHAICGSRSRPPKLPRYRCAGRSDATPCKLKSIAVPDLERAVIDAVLGHLAALEPEDPRLAAIARKWIARHAPEHDAQRREFAERADTLRARLEDLESAKWERGEFDDAEGPARYARFRTRIAEQLAAVESALAQLPEPTVDISALLDPAETAETFANTSPATLAERREVLALVLERVTVRSGGRIEPVWVGSNAEHLPIAEPLAA
ncbi:recombinase family protein [Thermobifida halotolerans]|uniref:Recombinase family protein n=1 Tax=Thermobifida halotolerans TaxID=483545 RepID=A0AA97M2J2_9ACTN|nr:recombinase family protein [Thermobifida halotolerans]